MEDQNKKSNSGINRRDMIKGLAALPVLGGFAAGAIYKRSEDKGLKEEILNELNIKAQAPPPTGPMSGDPIRIGIIGYGSRGKHLLKAMGYPTRQWIENAKKAAEKDKKNTQLKDYMEQENLNIKITGVCDVFDINAEIAVDSYTTDNNTCKRYLRYEDMLASKDIDAVVIATPDHWHAPISIDAVRAGKHVYVEKPMTHKITETYELLNAVKETGMVLQVGHQHRQTQSFLTAQDIIKKNVLGHVSLAQACTNRNSDNGAWQYRIHEKASPQTIDWEQFLGNSPEKVPFNKEHFFRWRKWWSYGSGLTGDLMTHDYDRVNCILNFGIPKYALTSGGIYTHRDGREVPDIINVSLEFPEYVQGFSQEPGKEKGLTFLYSASLGNSFHRPTLLMGHDATMEIGNTLYIYPDGNSTRFKEWKKQGIVKPGVPLYAYNPSAAGVDAVTSATAKYFADKGLLWTYRDGKRVDSAFLHIREWLSCIRNGGTPSCNIDVGFEEAITAQMSTLSYKLGKRMEWDPVKKEILNPDGVDFDQVLSSSQWPLVEVEG